MPRRKKEDLRARVGRLADPMGQQTERRGLEQLWFGNLAYYAGNPHFVAEGGTIRLPRRLNPRRKHYRANLIAPNVLRNVARLLEINLDFRVAPNSGAFADREAARIADKVWHHIKSVNESDETMMRALLWAAICGSGFIKCHFDPLAGTPMRTYQDENGLPWIPQTILEEREAEREGRFRDNFEGEVTHDVVSPFQMRWDWNAKDGGIKDCRWVAQVGAGMIEELVDRYGSDVRRKIKADHADSGAMRYEDAISTMAGAYGNNMGYHPTQLQGERCMVTEFFEVPMEANKWEGRYGLIAGEYVIRDDPNPYVETGNPLPFVKVDWWPMMGRFIGLSLVEQLREPQKAFNSSRSHQQDVEDTNGYPVTFLPSNAGVQPKKLVSYPGLILEVNAGVAGQIQTSNPPNLPPYIGENASRAREELNAISAMASPSKDAYPSQVRSSLAIGAIQQDNNSILTPTVRMYSSSWRSLGRQSLMIANKLYDIPRMIRTMGKGGEYEVEYFSSSDLRGHYDLRTYGEPAKLETSVAYQERMIQMMELGALDPQNPADRAAILKAMDAKTSDELMSDQLADERQEEKWIMRLRKNPNFQPPILGVENPHIRSKVLVRLIKSDEFFELSQQQQATVMQRWQAFNQMIQQEIEQQLLMAELTGPEKGKPSQPRRNKAPNG